MRARATRHAAADRTSSAGMGSPHLASRVETAGVHLASRGDVLARTLLASRGDPGQPAHTAPAGLQAASNLG